MARRYAWITITGKVYVEEDDMVEWLKNNRTDLPQVPDDSNLLAECTSEQEHEAFEEVAKNRAQELFPTDTPVKVEEIEVDMTTYRRLP